MEALGQWVALSNTGLIGGIFDLLAGDGATHSGLAGLASNVAALLGLL